MCALFHCVRAEKWSKRFHGDEQHLSVFLSGRARSLILFYEFTFRTPDPHQGAFMLGNILEHFEANGGEEKKTSARGLFLFVDTCNLRTHLGFVCVFDLGFTAVADRRSEAYI